jgi:hypothetical protein
MPASPSLAVFQAFNHRAKAAGWSFTCGPARDFEHAELAGALAVWHEKAQCRYAPTSPRAP